MTHDEQVRNIVEELVRLTQNGKVQWKAEDGSGTYSLRRPYGTVLVTGPGAVVSLRPLGRYRFSVLNREGVEIVDVDASLTVVSLPAMVAKISEQTKTQIQHLHALIQRREDQQGEELTEFLQELQRESM